MKQSVGDLAVFGGTPEFSDKLYVGRPNVPSEERLLERIRDLLGRKWLTNAGRYVQEFERRVAEYLGVRHCVAMCNATVALEIASRALGFRGEVIVPSFTFIATAHALQWQEITPVFCDVREETHNIDPARIEELITPRTTGILGVHLWGRPCDVDAISEIANRRKLKLLFDAAQAFGCSYKGRMIGNFGSAEVFSFHATKFLNTFEGGAVVTNDSELAQQIRLMKNFGFADYDEVIHIGINGKMTEVAAAMGLTSLEAIDEFLAANRENHDRYQRQFGNVPGIRLLSFDEAERCNHQYVVLEVDDELAGMRRDDLQQILWAENVIARRYFYPGCHRLEPYRSYFPHAGLLLPNTERLSQRVLTLPTGTSVAEDEVDRIASLIRFAIENAAEIGARLSIAVPATPPVAT
jgi:dTDP-4-amino-4,6-dideoxygalactose transaminase